MKKIILPLIATFSISVFAAKTCPNENEAAIPKGQTCVCRNDSSKEKECDREGGCDYFAMANLCNAKGKIINHSTIKTIKKQSNSQN